MIVLLCAALSGVMFYLSQGLDNVWALAWIAPLPLLWLAYGVTPRWQVFAAAVAAFAAGQVYMAQAYGGALPVLVIILSMFGFGALFATAIVQARTVQRRLPPPGGAACLSGLLDVHRISLQPGFAARQFWVTGLFASVLSGSHSDRIAVWPVCRDLHTVPVRQCTGAGGAGRAQRRRDGDRNLRAGPGIRVSAARRAAGGDGAGCRAGRLGRPAQDRAQAGSVCDPCHGASLCKCCAPAGRPRRAVHRHSRKPRWQPILSGAIPRWRRWRMWRAKCR